VPRSERTHPAKARKTAGESLSYRQERAIVELLQQPTLDAAAASAGITPRTLRRWLREKQFSQHYEKQRAMQLAGIHDVLRSSASDAVKVLVGISQDKAAKDAARVSAAARLIQFTFEVGELATIDKRLADLEEMVKRRK
jgi:hypothetical protein